MNALVSLFLCITLIYFNYSAISYKVVLACISDMFLCSSSVLYLEARVLDEHDPSIQLIGDLIIFSVFIHSLEASVLREYDPLILCYKRRKPRICLYA
jgi:hypothetical protein